MMVENIVTMVPWAENGFEVVGTSCVSRDAVEEICAQPPHLVFCDLKMPDMDGVEFMQVLRQNNIVCEFVMLTAYSDFDAVRNFFRLEGFDYLLKPLVENEVEMVLERISRKLAKENVATRQDNALALQIMPFDEIIQYLTDNIKKRHTLEGLSKKFNVSTSYICKLFAKNHGSTLTSFITDTRMKRAADMILNSDDALKVIAVNCGYTDYFYFCRVFKNHYGVAPTDYRQAGGKD